MCGRYTLYANPEDVMKDFGLGSIHRPYTVSYNVAPSQQVSVVVYSDQQKERVLTTMRWGLIPRWHKADQPLRMLNCARLETADTKPSFKHAFLNNRCLILADGFFEWHEKTKQPYFIQIASKKTFGMAGIWERWHDGEMVIDSCTILTQNPNTKIAAYHDRMPVIVKPENYEY
jgi:putative SOS response-associated peptidase YedK